MTITLNHHYRKLGQTDIEISPIGLGTVKFGRNEKVKYPQPFNIPNKETLVSLLNYSKELGINTLDTAPAYGSSEQTLGELLKQTRHEWIFISKCGESFENGESTYNFTRTAILKSVNNSLKNLRTDYIDLMLIHSDGKDIAIIEKHGVFETLEILKSQGKIRAYGMSSKTIEGGMLTAEKSDVVMVAYNQEDTSQLPVIKKASELNKGVLIKKALNSGHLVHSASKNLEQIYQEIFSIYGITSAIIGTINPTHLLENVSACLKAIKRNRP